MWRVHRHTFFYPFATIAVKQLIDTCRSIFEEKTSFLLTTHINPDGDGIGSELALARYLKLLGKKVTILNHDPTPEVFRFLDHRGEIELFDRESTSALSDQFEVICILDANQLDRVGSVGEFIRKSSALKICIDHHLDPEEFADLYLLDDTFASTGQIVYHIITKNRDSALPQEIVDPLYVAVMTDSGSFRFPKTDGPLHRVIAQLIDWGADPVSLYQQVYDQNTPHRIRLIGKMLANLETTNSGKVAYLIVTKEMFDETLTSEEDTDNVVNHTLTLKDVQIGLLFTELSGVIKISFRSRGDIHVNELAKEFGGNGHKNAAGARVFNESLQSVIRRVLEKSRTYIK